MIKKCLFPAAGYGTRFLPATKAVPKEMLPILTKPLLQYAVEEALDAGIENMAIVTGRGKRAIEDHFDESFELEAQIKNTDKTHYLEDINTIIRRATFTYIRQQKMLGLGHAVLTGEPLIGNEPFAVILADDLCIGAERGVIAQMVRVYQKYQCAVVAVEEVAPERVDQYGIIRGDLIEDGIYRVAEMIEKPAAARAPSNLAIIGRYLLTPDIFPILRTIKPNRGEIQITDALAEKAMKGEVVAYQFQGLRFDCGNIEGYVRATRHLAEKLGYED